MFSTCTPLKFSIPATCEQQEGLSPFLRQGTEVWTRVMTAHMSICTKLSNCKALGYNHQEHCLIQTGQARKELCLETTTGGPETAKMTSFEYFSSLPPPPSPNPQPPSFFSFFKCVGFVFLAKSWSAATHLCTSSSQKQIQVYTHYIHINRHGVWRNIQI